MVNVLVRFGVHCVRRNQLKFLLERVEHVEVQCSLKSGAFGSVEYSHITIVVALVAFIVGNDVEDWGDRDSALDLH